MPEISELPSVSSLSDDDLFVAVDLAAAAGQRTRKITWSRLQSLLSSAIGSAFATAAQGTKADSALQSIPAPTATTLGGVKSDSAGTGQFVTGIDTTGALTFGTSAGTGDMLASTYDPQGIAADAFDLANMTGTLADYATAAQGALADTALQPGDNTTGNAGTATKLATARTIAGVSFDGSTNIDIPFSGLTGVTISTSDPSGGSDGDLWFKVS